MVKKRKVPAQTKESQGALQLDASDSRKRITSYKDVADSNDEFHLNQDEIRLGEEPQAKRRRKWAEQEEFLEQSDEEVLDYSDGDEGEEETETAPRKAKRSRKGGAQSDSEGSEQGENDGNDDQELGWGTSKADLYGADDIETEEQALEEEAEALRLQKLQLESMDAADYGLDEDEWQKGAAPTADEDEDNGVVTEVLPQLQIAAGLGPAERLKLLKTRYPEFDLLSQELLSLKDTHAELAKAAEASPIYRIKLRAASAYLGALVMYFCLFTSTASQDGEGAAAMSATQLRDHPVMDSLVKCREVWSSVENLVEDDVTSESEDEIGDYNEAADSDAESDLSAPIDLKPAKKSRAERHAEATQLANEKRKAERMKRTEADLADLDALIAPSAMRKSKATKTVDTHSDDSDLGEEAPLTEREAADKAKRKKSLRFYTSQIAQKANKRGAAGRNAGGDDDIPHRERLRDRQTRLNAEAEKRGKRNADIGSDLGGDSDEDDRKQAEQIRAHADDDDDYYDMVAARASKKKNDKAALSEASRQAALQGGRLVPEEVVGQDGKRKISYLIEKNKGLTPHRKKDVRNPRVKRKKKYEEKKKKLASIKPIYKGGEGRGGYGGELTGIKKGLVKSTRL